MPSVTNVEQHARAVRRIAAAAMQAERDQHAGHRGDHEVQDDGAGHHQPEANCE